MTPPTSIQWVQQEDAMGCGIACVAMIAGISYQSVAVMVSQPIRQQGMTHYTVMDLLHRFAIPYQFLWRTDQLRQAQRNPWPPLPFANAHIVQVDNHYIVWTLDNKILDPARPIPLPLDAYETPRSILGCWPISQKSNTSTQRVDNGSLA